MTVTTIILRFLWSRLSREVKKNDGFILGSNHNINSSISIQKSYDKLDFGKKVNKKDDQIWKTAK